MEKEKEENIFEDTTTILSEFSEFDDDENESDEEDDWRQEKAVKSCLFDNEQKIKSREYFSVF